MRADRMRLHLLLISFLAMLASCSHQTQKTEDGEDPPAEPVITYIVRAGNFAAGYDGFFVELSAVEDGDMATRTPVLDAEITVNGGGHVSLPEGGTIFQGELAGPLSAGEHVELEIRIEDAVITGTTTVPQRAELTSPFPGQHFAADEPIVAEWAVADDANHYAILVLYSSGNDWQYQRDGSARSLELTLREGSRDGSVIRLQLMAGNIGSFTGPVYIPASSMTVENRSAYVEITVGP